MKNTKTFQNLMNAFAGESQAYQRYSMYSKVAGKEGWSNIAAIFDETAINEQQHAKQFFNLMCDMVGEDNMPEFMSLTASYPIAKSTTYANLMFSANGEKDEVVDYKEMAKIAEEEGFKDAATKFNLIADVEGHHASRYEKMAELLKIEQVVRKEERVQWKCMKCGYIHNGKAAPAVCPICDHPSGYFEKYELNI